MKSLGRVIVLCALSAALSAGSATAQTVFVTNAPADSTVEAVFNDQMPASAVADKMGLATMRLMAVTSGDIEARLYIEQCGDVRRIRLQTVAVALPAPGACTRQDSGSLFSVRPETSFVVDVELTPAVVRVRQGPPPAAWLTRLAPGEVISTRDFGPPGGAIVLSGGGGVLSSLSISEPQCGDLVECTKGHYKPLYTAGGTYWISRVVGIDGGYSRVTKVNASGSGDTFKFDTATRIDQITLVGKIGVPKGIARVYGLGGMTRQESLTRLSETINTSSSAGGTQSGAIKTRGWGLVYGGGLELWARAALGFYAEVTQSRLKGPDVHGGEARLDVKAPSAVIGIRVKVTP